MGDVDLLGVGALVLLLITQVLVDLKLRHAHFLVDIALANASQGQLFAQLAAKLFAVDAVFGQAFVDLRQLQLVLARNVLLCLVNRSVVDLDPGLSGCLQLSPFVDQALQGLRCHFLRVWQSLLPLRQLAGHPLRFEANLVAGDWLRVDDSNDVVGCALSGVAARLLWHRGRNCGQAQALGMDDQDRTAKKTAHQKVQKVTDHHGIIRNC